MVQKEEGRGVGPNLMREAPRAGQPTDPQKREDVIKSCAQILVRVQLLVMVPGDASPQGVGIFHQLPDNGWVYEGDATELEKFDRWQLTTLPEDLDIQAPLGPKDPAYSFSMKEHKGIDPLQPGQWKQEAALQRRLAPPDNEKRDIVYTNISNTLEQCISSQAHVVGFAISYHDYPTHNSYYGNNRKTARAKTLYLGWFDDVELKYGQPTEWHQRYAFKEEHPYYGISIQDPIPETVRSHQQIREARSSCSEPASSSRP